MTSGFLLINKPKGMTSHDVVDAVRHARGIRRVGHAGTLDPMATGLLIVGIGAATKKLGALQKLPKTYEAEVTLGATSTTDDAEGEVTERSQRQPSREEVERVLATFHGTMEQRPPTYAAIKIGGVAAHRRARRGEEIMLPPRSVTVYDASLLSYAYPHVDLRCVVSSGTYVRALARDLGEALGTGAHLSRLERTRIGPHRVEDALPLDDLPRAPLRQLVDGTKDR